VKRNGILLGSICLLLTFIYIYQEVGGIKRKEVSEKEGMLFDPTYLGAIKSFTNIKSTVLIDGKQYYLNPGRKPADERKVNAFFDALSSIRIKRELSAKEVEELGLRLFFTTEGSEVEKVIFRFDKSMITFTLGKKLDFDQSFYMKVTEEDGDKLKERFIIAFDQASLNVPVAKDTYHRTDVKYRRFQSLLYLGNDYFRDFRIFSSWMRSPWTLQKIVIDNKRNRNFSISLKEKTTTPLPPTFLNYSLEEFRTFEKEIALLEGTSIRDIKPNKAAHISTAFITSSKGEMKLELFSTMNSSNKIWLKANDLYYAVSEDVAKTFLGSVQRFWNLTLAKGLAMTHVSAQGKTLESRDKALIELLNKKASFVADSDYFIDATKLFDLNVRKSQYSLYTNKDEYFLLHQKSKIGLIYKKDNTNLIMYSKEVFK
jgi:hypothetical protein